MKEMNKIQTIRQVEEFAKRNIIHHDAGHEWWHLYRVRNLALYLQSAEGTGNRLVIEISALLHDIDDRKFTNCESTETEERIGTFLKSLDLEENIIKEVIFINRNISFSKGIIPVNRSCEFNIVQDADRLDAIGAIGIARAFTYGGFSDNPIYDPEGQIPSTIGHFYDKLLKLIDLMNTSAARKLAKERHNFMELFLKEFFKEWVFGKSP